MSLKRKGWKEIPIGGVCWKASTEYKTGDWRSFRPIYDKEKCIQCIFCHIFCPEGAVKYLKAKNVMFFDYDFCKGCGTCANECPTNAIEMVLEGKE
jgi:pyruvate ferredoxin oxidoreductase delta subunit